MKLYRLQTHDGVEDTCIEDSDGCCKTIYNNEDLRELMGDNMDVYNTPKDRFFNYGHSKVSIYNNDKIRFFFKDKDLFDKTIWMLRGMDLESEYYHVEYNYNPKYNNMIYEDPWQVAIEFNRLFKFRIIDVIK